MGNILKGDLKEKCNGLAPGIFRKINILGRTRRERERGRENSDRRRGGHHRRDARESVGENILTEGVASAIDASARPSVRNSSPKAWRALEFIIVIVILNILTRSGRERERGRGNSHPRRGERDRRDAGEAVGENFLPHGLARAIDASTRPCRVAFGPPRRDPRVPIKTKSVKKKIA